ncbi:MAG: hypothetical protein M3P11_10140 [Actinomycetota bacterium]|nr:hypothetical protein [Actinomycetota bacterium]
MTPTRLRDGLRHSVLVFLAVRVGVSLLSIIGVTLIEPRRSPPLPVVPGWPIAPVTAGWHNLVTALERQDAAWFLRIATHGYTHGDGSAAFFPLYPLAIHVVSWLPGVGPLGAALIVSNLAFLGALVVLHGLTRLEGMTEETARRTTLFLAIFPTAFFLLAPYSEAPFLLLSIAAFWFARKDRWALAASMGALAALTRSIGVMLIPALAVEAILQWRQGRALAPRLTAAAGVAAGPFIYFLYWQVRFGDFWAALHAQQNWGRTLSSPITTVRWALSYADPGTYQLVDVLVVAIVLLAVVAGARMLRASYLVYAIASLLVPLCYWASFRPLLSMPRLVVVVFPAFWVLARATERRWLPEPLVTGTFAAGYGILLVLFVNWWHIF